MGGQICPLAVMARNLQPRDPTHTHTQDPPRIRVAPYSDVMTQQGQMGVSLFQPRSPSLVFEGWKPSTETIFCLAGRGRPNLCSRVFGIPVQDAKPLALQSNLWRLGEARAKCFDVRLGLAWGEGGVQDTHKGAQTWGGILCS